MNSVILLAVSARHIWHSQANQLLCQVRRLMRQKMFPQPARETCNSDTQCNLGMGRQLSHCLSYMYVCDACALLCFCSVCPSEPVRFHRNRRMHQLDLYSKLASAFASQRKVNSGKTADAVLKLTRAVEGELWSTD